MCVQAGSHGILAAMKLPISEEFRVTSALPAGANVCESALC